MGELLGLRWEDIDIQSGLMHIRRTLNRLKKKEKTLAPGESKTEIVIQSPKSQNSIRSIPLLPAVMQDLMGWKAVQQSDQQAAGELYQASGFIVTNPLGGYMEPRTFKDQYDQMLNMAGLEHFTFHALRHPYVKPTTQTFSTFLKFRGFKSKITHLPDNFNLITRKDMHSLNQRINQFRA